MFKTSEAKIYMKLAFKDLFIFVYLQPQSCCHVERKVGVGISHEQFEVWPVVV